MHQQHGIFYNTTETSDQIVSIYYLLLMSDYDAHILLGHARTQKDHLSLINSGLPVEEKAVLFCVN